jgi:hypothetical protein
MNPSVSRLLVAACALALLCQACLGPVRDARPFHEAPDRFVRLEARYGDQRRAGATRFAHPFKLSPDEWARILSNIRVQSRKDTFLFTMAKEPPTQAFAPDEIAYLGRTLSEAFAKAYPDEYVVFGLSRARSPQMSEITTGGWFVEGPRLHLILGNYRHGVTRSSAREQVWQDPLRMDTAPYFDLVEGPYQTVVQGRGIFSGLLAKDGPELAIDYEALLEGKGVSPADSTVEERLRALKKLKDEGLITEEEYREKKKQVLDTF